MFFLKFRKCHKMVSSIYPMLFSFGILGFDMGLLVMMKFGFVNSLFFSLFYLLFISFIWVKDVSFESMSGQYSFQDLRMFFHGFYLFLFSELVLFFVIFWSFLDSSLSSLMWIGDYWCPMGILSMDYIGMSVIASSFLMMNSQILKYARRYLFLNNFFCEIFLLMSIFIGGGFVCFQFFEYNNSPFTFLDSIYGNIFFIGTGLHGLHVFLGVCLIIISFFRLKFFNFNWFDTQIFDMSVNYWRFLEWMWGFMFSLLYIWGS
uniref:Cytochrome c oxidase subunit 3 n=1 Tax=Neofoleyellides sp. XM-2022 TaxID=3014012 RepID=A0A9E9FU75_9BILA|nr:cytochrome coxidase subunit 3 [Neofoleyellides sp. XM-2022]